jgi:hypothetical protein
MTQIRLGLSMPVNSQKDVKQLTEHPKAYFREHGIVMGKKLEAQAEAELKALQQAGILPQKSQKKGWLG